METAKTETVKPMSLRAYARRRKTSAPSVLRAIRAQRLVKSLVWVNGKAQIGDAELADEEWAANTDHSRAPGAVKEEAAARVTRPTGVTRPVTSATLADAAREEKTWKAKQAELDYRREAGELVLVSDVAKEAFESSRIIREAVLNVPARLSAELAAEPDARRVYLKLDAALREALSAAADALDAAKTA